MNAPALSVIIPTHNNLPVLRQCIARWERLSGTTDLELIVIEDGCSDETPKWLDALSGTGWGAAHLRCVHEDNAHEQTCTNRGFAESRGALLLVWQDDMLLDRDWLAPELLRTFARHGDLGLLGLTRGLDCHPVDRPILKWEDLTEWDRLSSTIGPAPWNWLAIQEVDFVIRPWAVRREAIARVGPLDPAFVLSEWDEADLAFRLRQAGWRVGTHGYERLGAYMHLGSSTLARSFTDTYKAQVLKNGLLFHDRWDEEIAHSHARERKTWPRAATSRAWFDAVRAAGRMLRRRVLPRAW